LNKARLKVARIYEKIVNARRDFLHQLSTKPRDLPEGLESEEYAQESQAGEIHYGCVLVGVCCDAGVQGGMVRTNHPKSGQAVPILSTLFRLW
jgi:hypothetical protein